MVTTTLTRVRQRSFNITIAPRSHNLVLYELSNRRTHTLVAHWSSRFPEEDIRDDARLVVGVIGVESASPIYHDSKDFLKNELLAAGRSYMHTYKTMVNIILRTLGTRPYFSASILPGALLGLGINRRSRLRYNGVISMVDKRGVHKMTCFCTHAVYRPDSRACSNV